MFSHRFILVFLLVLAGCSYRENKGQPTLSSGAVGFAEIRDQILTPSCIGCHSGTKPMRLVTFEEVKANLNRIRDAVLVRKIMPKRGPLGENEMTMLAKWMDDGAPEIGTGPAVPAPATGAARPVVKWAELKQKVLNGRCFVCHYADNPDKISNLDDLETFQGTVGTSYFLSVVSASMPPAPKGTPEGAPNPSELSRAEKELLSFWLVDGMKP